MTNQGATKINTAANPFAITFKPTSTNAAAKNNLCKYFFLKLLIVFQIRISFLIYISL